jgi:hypothetical protein
VFTYTALRGEELAPGTTGVYANTATVTLDSRPVLRMFTTLSPFIGAAPITDGAIVRVTTGLPLTVTGEGNGTLTRTHGWELVKQVQDAQGAWVDATTMPAAQDGHADFAFRVVVRPTDATDSDWQFTGTARIHNPNAWDVTARTITATISGDGQPLGEVPLDDLVIPAGDGVDIDLTAVVAGVDHHQFDQVTVTITWDQDEAYSATAEHSVTIPVTWDADHAPVNRIVDVYDDLAGTVDEPVLLGTVDWYAHSADAVTDVPDYVDVTLVDDEYHFAYTLALWSDADAAVTPFTNHAWLVAHGADGDDAAPIAQDDADESITRYTPPTPDNPAPADPAPKDPAPAPQAGGSSLTTHTGGAAIGTNGWELLGLALALALVGAAALLLDRRRTRRHPGGANG